MYKQRVVITGIGMVSPAGVGKEQFADTILNGKNTIGEVNLFEPDFFVVPKGSQLKNFEPSTYLKKEEIENLSDVSIVSVIAAKLAILDSQLKLTETNGIHAIDSVDPTQIGVVLGTGVGASSDYEKMIETVTEEDWSKVSPSLIRNFRNNDFAKAISDYFGIRGMNQVISTACSAGNDAIIYAYNQIKHGKAKLMIAGGSELISKAAIIGFIRMNAMAKDLCRPFDLERTGIVVGEGSAMLVLESLEHALERKAPIYGEIAGYGVSCDAYHLTTPDSSAGGGPVKALKKAINSSNVENTEIDYICAHGTGTHANDSTETRAIKEVFGDYAYKIPVSSIKSIIGHTGGAAGAFGAIACLLAMQNSMIPPTIHYTTPDPECDLDYVPNVPRKKAVRVAVNNSFAFGGNNTCLVLKQYSEKPIEN